ncbi:MAG: DUF3999 domain-containing protein [Nitrospirota bacterium]
MKIGWASGLALVIALGATAYAETVTPRDFAYGFSLKTDGDGAIYRLALPEEVYRSATRTDLGDVRVFNGAGEWVPHTIGTAPDDPDPMREEMTLPLFPVWETGDRGRPRLELDVRTDEKGAIVRVQEQAPREPASRIGGYLLDASAVSNSIDGIRLAWTQTNESVATKIRVDGSDDLTYWRSLVEQATVADLRYEGKSLEQRTVAVHSTGAKYLRLTWAEGSPSLLLTEVWAILAPPQRTTPRRWSFLTASGGEAEPIGYVFGNAGALPVDRIRIRLRQPNTLIQGTLQSRPDDKSPWHVRHKGLFYHVTVDGLTVESDPATIPLTRDRYWRLELNGESPDPGDLQPTLELGWVPQNVYFLANGQEPFMLAFGSAAVGPAGRPVDALLNALRDEHKRALIKEAHADGRADLGGADMLKPPPPPLPWKEWLLWSVLAAGVFILSALAWRLYRDMNRPAS